MSRVPPHRRDTRAYYARYLRQSFANWTDERDAARLQQLAERRIHRLFVTDEAGQPAGVVSATDILRLVAGSCGTRPSSAAVSSAAMESD